MGVVKSTAVALAVTYAGVASAAPAFVQQGCNQRLGAQILTATLPQPAAAGSLIVVAIGFNGSTITISSVADTLGNAFQPAFTLTRSSTGQSVQTFYASSAADGPETVTVTLSRAVSIVGGLEVMVHEYSGASAAAPLFATNTGSSNAPNSGQLDVTAAGSVLVAHAMHTNTISAVQAPFTTRNTCGDRTADAIASSAGAYTATFSASSNAAWVASVVAFPPATTQPNGEACSSSGECTSGYCVDGVCCQGPCGNSDPADCQSCALTPGVCTLAPPGTICRAAAGVCDAPETCTGGSPSCPTNSFLPTSTVCRAAAGDCDAAETCQGTANCPADSLLPSSTVCRTSAGDCDVAETCNGNANCPADAFLSGSTACRPSAGTCDVVESCPGTSAQCPSDAFMPSSTVCRSARGDCDLAESCTGSDPRCPGDGLRSSAEPCRPAADVCDTPERCDCAAADCPPDWFAGPAVECRATSGACDRAEHCTGTDVRCPLDSLSAAGELCRARAGDCDQEESCTGADVLCPPDAFAPASVECRASAGPCDVAETCSGSGAACPADARASIVLVCRPAQDACDLPETCDGLAPGCPADARSMVRIVQDASPGAAVGVPYRYNAAARVTVTGVLTGAAYRNCTVAAPLASGFHVDPASGSVRWVPTAAGTAPLCVGVDDGCTTDEYRFDVQVGDASGPAPTAAFAPAPTSPRVGDRVTFDGSASRAPPGATLVAFEWTFGDGAGAFGQRAEHAYAAAGGYGVHLKIYDSAGRTGEASLSLPVGDDQCPSPPRAVVRASPGSGAAPLEVQFGCDCERAIARTWTFGDGAFSSEADPLHRYDGGRFTARVIAVDENGCAASDAVSIAVSRDGLQPPWCRASVAPAIGAAPLEVRFEGVAQDPNPGAAVRRARWIFEDGSELAEPVATRSFSAPGIFGSEWLVESDTGLTCSEPVQVTAAASDGAVPLHIVTRPNTSARCLAPYRYSPVVAGPLASGSRPVRWELGALEDGQQTGAPTGMTVDESSGAVTWIPPEGTPERQRVILVAHNGAGSARQDFEIDVHCPAVSYEVSCGCGTPASAEAPLGAALLLALTASAARARQRGRRSPAPAAPSTLAC